MSQHAGTALKLASALMGATPRVEVFTFSTTLERVTSEPLRDDLRRACRKVGFKFVALDLGGLQSGSVSLPLVAS